MNDILKQFYERHPAYDRRANDGFLLEKAGQPLTVEGLEGASKILEATLLLAPEYQSAWDEFVYFNPEKSGLAFRREFIEKLEVKEIQAARAHERATLVKALGEQFHGLPLSDLREIAANRRENARRKSLSREELSALAKAAHPAPTADDLPWTYAPFGKTESIELTAEVLRGAGGRNSPLTIRDFKFLCDRYTSIRVNERMNGSAKRQYKPLPPEITREQVIAAMSNKELAPIWSREYGSTNLNNRIFGMS